VPVILVTFLIKLNFFRQIFEKSSNITVHENPSSGIRFVLREQTDVPALRNFANHQEANAWTCLMSEKNISTNDVVCCVYILSVGLQECFRKDDTQSVTKYLGFCRTQCVTSL
jgi:hypothetical protein